MSRRTRAVLTLVGFLSVLTAVVAYEMRWLELVLFTLHAGLLIVMSVAVLLRPCSYTQRGPFSMYPRTVRRWILDERD